MASGTSGRAIGVFIRAPSIIKADSARVSILATIRDYPQNDTETTGDEKGKELIVAVEQENLIGTSFHPELTDDTRWHEYFIQKTIQTKLATTK